MKYSLSILALVYSFTAFSQAEVSLKFTYHDKPVCGYEITIKHGNAAIGVGTTDSNGDVTFSDVMLLSKDIDIYGKKNTAGGDKTFDAKGYVTLDDNNHAEIKMDIFAKEVSEDSGGMMPESFFVDAWGLNGLDCK